MGRIYVPLSQLHIPEEHVPTDIVYGDLVRTLRMDNARYTPPTIDARNNVLIGAVYAKAAKEAGLDTILVEGEGTTDETPRRWKRSLLHNFVFFEKLRFTTPLHKEFIAYHESCDQAIKNPFGEESRIDTVTYKRIRPDILEYSVQGSLATPEDRYLLSGPTAELYIALQEKLGPIRSVNGIRIAPAPGSRNS